MVLLRPGISLACIPAAASRVPACAAVYGDGSGNNGGLGKRKWHSWGEGAGVPSGGSSGRAWWCAALAGVGQLCLTTGDAHARKEAPKSKELTVESVTSALWQVSAPMITNLGFSGCCGLATGVALKKIGQFVAVALGLGFLALQGLAQMGYISVNWTAVQAKMNAIFDVNRDGKVDEKEFKAVSVRGLAMLAQGVPSVGGFLTGFLLGMQM